MQKAVLAKNVTQSCRRIGLGMKDCAVLLGSLLVIITFAWRNTGLRPVLLDPRTPPSVVDYRLVVIIPYMVNLLLYYLFSHCYTWHRNLIIVALTIKPVACRPFLTMCF
jgi:hypothetical protein